MDYKITKIEMTESGLEATGKFECGIDANVTMDAFTSINTETLHAVNEFFAGIARTLDVTMTALEEGE